MEPFKVGDRVRLTLAAYERRASRFFHDEVMIVEEVIPHVPTLNIEPLPSMWSYTFRMGPILCKFFQYELRPA